MFGFPSHNLKVVGSNPTPATTKFNETNGLTKGIDRKIGAYFVSEKPECRRLIWQDSADLRCRMAKIPTKSTSVNTFSNTNMPKNLKAVGRFALVAVVAWP